MEKPTEALPTGKEDYALPEVLVSPHIIGLPPNEKVQSDAGDEQALKRVDTLIKDYEKNTENTIPKDWKVAPLGETKKEKKWLEMCHSIASGKEETIIEGLLGGVQCGSFPLRDGRTLQVEIPKDGPNAKQILCTLETPRGTKERWKLSPLFIEHDDGARQTLQEIHICRITLLNGEQPTDVSASIQMDRFFHPSTRRWLWATIRRKAELTPIDCDAFTQQTRRVLRQYRSHERDAANIQALDLPKNEPIGYMALLGSDEDSSFMADNATFFTKVLAKQGYDIYCSPGAGSIEPLEAGKRSPSDIIRSTISVYRKQGIRSLFIDLYGHGDEDGGGIIFQGQRRELLDIAISRKMKCLSPDELRKIIEENRDMQIFCKTNACFGGNFYSAMQAPFTNDKAMREQYVFTEVDREVVNIDSFSGGTIPLSVYRAVLIESINNGIPFGEAHLRAYRAAKERYGFMPQFWRITPTRTFHTSDASKPSGANIG